jgi:hypothetical protein
MPRMTCYELLRFYKTKVAIAEAGDVDRQVVQGWFERDRIPLDQQTKYEVATNGELKADVTEEFREVVARGQASSLTP